MILSAKFNVNINKDLVYLPQTLSTNIAANGGLGLLYITPLVGNMGNVNSMYVQIPAVSGATSGTHILQIAAGTTNAGALVTITSPYNQNITIQGLAVTNGTPVPADVSAIATALSNVIFDNNLPLYFKYTNNTNAAQTGTRIYNTMYVLTGEETTF
jgi:hypothetical protein